jgi:hypothetical protein
VTPSSDTYMKPPVACPQSTFLPRQSYSSVFLLRVLCDRTIKCCSPPTMAPRSESRVW